MEENAKRLQNVTDLVIPNDFPRPVDSKFVESRVTRSISEKTALSILKLSIAWSEGQSEETCSPFDILLGGFSVLLQKHTGMEDLSVGSSSLSKNPLVLRFNVSGDISFLKVMQNIMESTKDALETEVPFLELLEFMASNSSLFKVRFFNLTDTSSDTLTPSATDLTIVISQSESVKKLLPIQISILYNSVIFSSIRIHDILDQLELIIQIAASNPHADIGEYSLVTQDSKQRLPDPTLDLNWDIFEGAITDIFAKRAILHPSRTCVVESNENTNSTISFSYKQIHEASNTVAHALLNGGIQREDVVVLYSYRCVDLVVAILGVLKAGATFSVIDPAYPPKRQIVYLDVAKPRGLIVLKKAGILDVSVTSYISDNLVMKFTIPALELLANGSIRGADDDIFKNTSNTYPNIEIGPDSIGTLSFTSGSTGIPKGVRGRHFSLTHFYPWMQKEFKLSEADRFTMLSGIAHDPIQRDIFTPLFLGAELHIPTSSDILTPGRLAEWMSEHKISVTHLTPAMGQLLSANATQKIESLRNSFFVGDILTKRDVSRLQVIAPNSTIINMYGTTETQRAVSYMAIPSLNSNPTFLSTQKDVMNAGKGMKDVQLLIINSYGGLCGVGEVGEIYVRSSGLSEGYLGLPDGTKMKFLPNPFNDLDPGSTSPFFFGKRDRMYKTGDLGRYNPDGSVECTGRADDQVKIRGFRIELGEIDTYLSQHPSVRENVTLVRRDAYEEPTIVSYFVPLEDLSNEELKNLIRNIREYLKTKLPVYAVPSVIAPIGRMPLTPNGKIDKNILPFPDTVLQSSTNVDGEVSSIQNSVRAVWATLLNVKAESIALDDNFFDLGGHSILATNLIFQLRKSLAVEIPLGAIYKNPTINGIAIEIEKLVGVTLKVNRPELNRQPSQNNLEPEFEYASDLETVDDLSICSEGLPAYELLGWPTLTPIFFLTGATGFLGIFILSSLIERFPNAKVFCLVRAENKDSALERIISNAKRHLIWKDSWIPKIDAVVGDLGQEKFGIDDDTWNKLCNSVDIIVHNGALVHWVYPYHKLRAANVLGTVWALKLATTTRLKAVHLVSSTSVLDTEHYINAYLNNGKPVPEEDDLSGAEKGLRSGYGQSKWVAEKLIMRARNRGVPCTIIRPGYIVGDSKTGGIFVKGCIQLGQIPGISNVVNMCPVDYVADVVAVVVGNSKSFDMGIFHIWNPFSFHFDDLFGYIKQFGYEVALTDYITWRAALMDLTLTTTQSSSEYHALFPLLHFVLDDLPTSTRSPELSNSNVIEICKGTNVECKDIRNLMDLYFGYLVHIEFLAATKFQHSECIAWKQLQGLKAVARTGQ